MFVSFNVCHDKSRMHGVWGCMGMGYRIRQGILALMKCHMAHGPNLTLLLETDALGDKRGREPRGM